MSEPEDPYARFELEDVSLRDQLAIDRTLLANERTLLAYLRSGVALALAGFTFIHLFEGSWLAYVGILALPSAFVVLAVGITRWRRMDRAIGSVRDHLIR